MINSTKSLIRNRCKARGVMFVFLLLASVVGHAQFTPDDPYFQPGTANGTLSGYYGQWHLINQMPVNPANAGYDVNVAGAWARGLTGNGVIISVVDDGTQSLHPDLSEGFENALSWDYSLSPAANWASSNRGSPVLINDNHGTAVAGVAGARGGNGIGVTGAAPLAGIAAQRFLTGGSYHGGISETQAEIYAVGFQGQTDGMGNPDPTATFIGTNAPVRIMNHSYGSNQGFVADVLSPSFLTALDASAQLGVVHVYSAGNQRGEWPTADTGKILASNSPGVMVVAALGSDGTYADYSSYGSAVIVTAPSSSRAPVGQFRISTTDRTGLDGYNNIGDGPPEPSADDPYFAPPSSGDLNSYSSTFGGTSSAAPLVSGVMALAVEANPDMDIRMARQLMARTSVKVDPTNPDWITNSAGFDFNKNYGFGLIDADALTLQATQVISMSALAVHSSPEITVGDSFLPASLTLEQDITLSLIDPLPIEYVQVALSVSNFQTDLTEYSSGGIGALLGDLSGVVISPSGTSYQLFSNDRFLIDTDDEANRNDEDSLVWTFTSYAYFGESPNGDWTVQLTNGSTNTEPSLFGTWDNLQLTIGTGSISIIPEPGVWALLILGGLLLIAQQRFLRLTR